MAKKTKPLVLYSTVTWLSYTISEAYYNQEHFVWCSPEFDCSGPGRISARTPPTASPKEIYKSLWEEVDRGDKHSAKIKSTKKGILTGARIKQDAGIISLDQAVEIREIIAGSSISDFRPLLCIIPYALVTRLIKSVPIKKRAHALSQEFIIENLPRKLFDIVEL